MIIDMEIPYYSNCTIVVYTVVYPWSLVSNILSRYFYLSVTIFTASIAV